MVAPAAAGQPPTLLKALLKNRTTRRITSTASTTRSHRDDTGNDGCDMASVVSPTATVSSSTLRIQLLKGSGLVLAAVRVTAFAPCDVSATEPPTSAARIFHASGMPEKMPKLSPAATMGPHQGVNGVPHRVDVRDLVGEELDEEEDGRPEDHHGVTQDAESGGQGKEMEVLRRTENGDGGVDVQSGRERRAECQAEELKGFHPA